MATQYVYLTGTTEYVNLAKPDKFEKYTLGLRLDKESLATFKDLGLKIAIKDKNLVYLNRRIQMQKMNGEVIEFGPPQVIDKDKNEVPVDEYSKAWTGAEVTAKVVVYDSSRGKGHRLEAVRIDTPSPLADGAPQVLGEVDVPF